MNICVLSDLHGQLINIEPCELLLICGDIVPLNIQRNTDKSLQWFIGKFIPWCSSKFNHVYFIGGNHDFFLEKEESTVKDYLEDSNITLLNNEEAIYSNSEKTIKIWGSPMCHIFGNWAFMYDDEYEEKMFNKMPDKFDILLTHDAAYGRSDVLLQKDIQWADGSHIGNLALNKVLENKYPKYHFFWHLHSCLHELTDFNGTLTACVSILDERYNYYYSPLYLNL